MASWTPQYSTLLSQILDILVGTKEGIEIRQDYCKILDSIYSVVLGKNRYFTGSKAEGLVLPGSDEDYMYEINNEYNIKVIQSLEDNTSTSPYSTFVMSSENVRPGFTFLHHVCQTPLPPFLYQACQNMNGLRYLSSDLFIQNAIKENQRGISKYFNECITMRRQGPSMEALTPGIPEEESMDHVNCIRCEFWPSEASEWRERPRHFGWPTQGDIVSIIDFGFHLVAIGHPNSDTKLMEWRISFSLAERTLVWSFNHVQMQCYAVMKMILKHFIKVRCSPHNQVLCSYFIKTFLFWKYEMTDANFWREDNIRECINYLLVEFCKCVSEGMLRHYFIPRFNLLSVKLTPAARRELLQLFDIIIASDISIMQDCRHLQEVWSTFSQFIAIGNEFIESCIINRTKPNLVSNDRYMREKCENLEFYYIFVLCWYPLSLLKVFSQILSLFCKTPLQDLVLKRILLDIDIASAIHTCSENRYVYRLKRIAGNEISSFDISTSKLWCAILLYMAGDYSSTLDIINQVLSSIPPFAMHRNVSNESEELYMDVFGGSDMTIIQRARKAWMFPMIFHKNTSHPLPLAIQIELHFSLLDIGLEPLTCAYYLQFLCYFDLHRYDSRDRALEQLVDVAKHAPKYGNYSDLNIAGHCLLLAGKRVEARDLFHISYIVKRSSPLIPQPQISAQWYIQNCCSI